MFLNNLKLKVWTKTLKRVYICFESWEKNVSQPLLKKKDFKNPFFEDKKKKD